MAVDIPFKNGTGSPFIQPPLPTPLKDEGFIGFDAYDIPHKGTLINGIKLAGVSNGSFEGRLNDSVVWTVSLSDVDAALDAWVGSGACCWYDSVNDRLYVFATDTGTTPDTLYTAYITLETGAVTNVGNIQLTTDPTAGATLGNALCTRPNIDSGDFTLEFNDRIIVIDETDGSEVSNVVATEPLTGIGTYMSGTASFDGHVASSTETNTRINRNRRSTRIPSPNGAIASGVTVVYAVAWGDNVKMFNTSGSEYFYRTFLKTDFDDWLEAMADLGGLA